MKDEMEFLTRTSLSSSFYLPNNTTVCTSTSVQLRRAGQQGLTGTLSAVLEHTHPLKCEIKQLLGAYSITQVKYYKHTRKLAFSA